jgi:hypothetical protein
MVAMVWVLTRLSGTDEVLAPAVMLSLRLTRSLAASIEAKNRPWSQRSSPWTHGGWRLRKRTQFLVVSETVERADAI